MTSAPGVEDHWLKANNNPIFKVTIRKQQHQQQQQH